jgi:hypothetical protein
MRCVLALLLLSTTAHADPADFGELHATAAGELTFSDTESAFGFRGQFLLGKSIKTKSEQRPSFSIGPTFGAGTMQLETSEWASYRNIGIVGQLGLRFVNGGYVDDRIYVSLSILHATLDHQRAVGVRGAFGVNAADVLYHAKLAALPHAWEFVVENDGRGTRAGFTVGYGI